MYGKVKLGTLIGQVFVRAPIFFVESQEKLIVCLRRLVCQIGQYGLIINIIDKYTIQRKGQYLN